MSEPERPHLVVVPPEDERWPPWVENFVLPFVYVHGLRAVLGILLAHVSLAIVLVLLPVIRSFDLIALGGLFALFMFSLTVVQAELRIRKRPAEFCAMLGISWAVAIVAALLLKDTGYL